MTNKSVKREFLICKKVFGNKCCKCGSTEKLEFAHIKPTKLYGKGRGSNQRYLDIMNNFDCYNLFCKDCHTEFDNNVSLS